MGQTRGRLSKVVGTKKMEHITRGYPSEPTCNGFVLGLGRDLVLLQQFHDFYPEGYTALRIADIKRVRSGERERFRETMFRGEGLMEQIGISYEVPLGDYRSLLAALYGRRQHVIVECEDRKTTANDEFFIGRIIDVRDETVSIRYFDSMGRWDEEPCVIDYEDVTKIQFDTPYINTKS
jgi:hypothetical protein